MLANNLLTTTSNQSYLGKFTVVRIGEDEASFSPLIMITSDDNELSHAIHQIDAIKVTEGPFLEG